MSDNWIKVEDDLPRDCQLVIGYSKQVPQEVIPMYYFSEEGFRAAVPTSFNNVIIDDVTHWQPLPPPPGKTDEELLSLKRAVAQDMANKKGETMRLSLGHGKYEEFKPH